MSTKQVVMLGSAIGGITSLFILGLLLFGESGVLSWRHTDWMYVLWPSSILLVVGWRSTGSGHDDHHCIDCIELRDVHRGRFRVPGSSPINCQTQNPLRQSLITNVFESMLLFFEGTLPFAGIDSPPLTGRLKSC
jgi:hypothetical protein